MADIPQDLERFVRDFALFQQRFMTQPAVAGAVPPRPEGTAATPAASAGQPPRRRA